MKDKRKDGKQKSKTPAQHNTTEGTRRKRLKPENKIKYKINRYQLSEDFEDEDYSLYDEKVADEE